MQKLIKERFALEQLEAERERRIVEKIESGKAVLMPPAVFAAPQPETIERDELGREVYRGVRIEDGKIELISAILSGVPRANRDQNYEAPPPDKSMAPA